MIDLELQLLEDTPDGLRVLIAYQQATEALIVEEKVATLAHEKAHAEALSKTASLEPEHADPGDSPDLGVESRPENEDADGAESTVVPKRRAATWLTRITTVEGVESQALSKIHGQFIAYGLLKCDLADRSSGMVYQLTSTAKQVLAKLAKSVDDDEFAGEELDSEDYEVSSEDHGQQTAAA